MLLVPLDCIAKKGKYFLVLLKWTLKNTVAWKRPTESHTIPHLPLWIEGDALKISPLFEELQEVEEKSIFFRGKLQDLLPMPK